MQISILVAEQDHLTHELLQQVIKYNLEEVNSVHCYSSEECLHLARTIKPDLILLSLNLPDNDYLDVLKQLKDIDETKDIPVLALVNDDWYFRRTKLKSQGFTNYIRKPVSSIEVKRIVKSCLNKPVD